MCASLSPGVSDPLRVFVVEDHADTLTYLLLYLEMRGHQVAAATSMGGALAALPGAGCNVLISDIGLPDGDGWELLRRLQPLLPQPMYAVSMSGFSLPTGQQRSRDAGYRRHLFKPFKVAELDAVLEEAAREHLGSGPDEAAR